MMGFLTMGGGGGGGMPVEIQERETEALRVLL